MSVGSQALERSALESKDRDSLVQIATAMGGKPASRAKKADIIDQILELAGVTPASASADAEAPGETPDATAEAAARPPAAAGRRRGRAEAEAPASDGPDDAARTQPDASADTDTDTDTDTGDDADGNDRGGRNDRGDRSSSDRAPSGPDTAESADHGDEAGGQQANGSGPREDGETGNRRRRRRGRDRDRNREGVQPGGAPAPGDDQWQGEPVEVAGLLDLRDEGYGFLRLNGYLPSRDDVYVSVKQVRQFGLRKGDHLKGASRPAARNEKNPALLRIDEVNGADPELNRERRRFDELTPVVPHERLRLERADDLTARVIDLVAPVGKGQRGLIVTPTGPAAATTSILTSIGRSIEANHPDVHLLVLLVDERPEEVTDVRRSVQGEVVASTFDRPADEHTMVAELALERAKRLVEDGKDVVVLFDGLTRLARAHNLSAPAAGRLVGGIDASALFPPKRFFGAARSLEEGGSLTILATVAAPTGSPIDDVVLDELTGTQNLELRLDQHLADRRLQPAVDVVSSATAHEDQLLDDDELDAATALRRTLADLRDEAGPAAALEQLLDRLGAHDTNEALLAAAAKEG
jgi:transcription termination factor Rho